MFIIDFEGLDCSFKETNSKQLVKFLNAKGITAKRWAFPQYDKESSVHVRDYLAGKYKDYAANTVRKGWEQAFTPGVGEEVKDDFFVTAASFYMMDMLSAWVNEIKDSDVEVAVFDRWWYSNLYYQSATKTLSRDSYHEIYCAAARIIPVPADIVINMHSDLKHLLDTVHAKNSENDIHESNDEFLTDVFGRFTAYSTIASDQLIPVNVSVLDEQKELMDRDGVFSSVLSALEDHLYMTSFKDDKKETADKILNALRG